MLARVDDRLRLPPFLTSALWVCPKTRTMHAFGVIRRPAERSPRVVLSWTSFPRAHAWSMSSA